MIKYFTDEQLIRKDGHPPHFRVFDDNPFAEGYFFTAEGGYSLRNKYVPRSGKPGLNCALGGDEDDRVKIGNRSLVAHTLGLSSYQRLLSTQLSDPTVLTVTQPWPIDLINNRKALPKNEALVARDLYDYALCSLGADCPTILLADKARPIIGACHLLWRTLANGLLEKTIQAMEQQGSRRSDIQAAISQSLGVEVGINDTEDCIAAACEQEPRIGKFFRSFGQDACKRPQTAFWLHDYLTDALQSAGIDDITRIHKDTLTHPDCYSQNAGSDRTSVMLFAVKLRTPPWVEPR